MGRYDFGSFANQWGQTDWNLVAQATEKPKKGSLLGYLKEKPTNVQQASGGRYTRMPKLEEGQSYSPAPGLAAVGTQQVNVNGTNNTLTVYGKVNAQKNDSKNTSSSKSNSQNNNSSSGGGSMANPGGGGDSGPYAWDPTNREALEARTRAAAYSKSVADSSLPEYRHEGYLSASGRPNYDAGTRAATDYGFASARAGLKMADAFSDQAALQAAEWSGVSSSALARAQFEPPKADINTKSLAKDIGRLSKAIA